MSVKDISID